MSIHVPVRGSEPSDEIPDHWYAYISANDQNIVFGVSYYMEIPEIDDWQGESLFNTDAGLLIVDLKDLIDSYIDNCEAEDGGDGLTDLADALAKCEIKLRERAAELNNQ